MSKHDDNTSDDEFLDAVSTTKSNEDCINEVLSKDSPYLPEELRPEDPKREQGATSSANDVYSDCYDDLIDEEGLMEEEKLLSEEEKIKNKQEADQLKLEGNELFKNDKCAQSVQVYTNALKLCPLKYTKERAILYANRAAAKIKLDSKNAAIEDCSKAIELDQGYVRALLRRAKLYESSDRLDDSLADFKRVLELDTYNREAMEAAARLAPLVDARNEKLKAEMMDQFKNLGNMILKPFGLSTSNFEMKQDPSTGSYSINMKQDQR